MESMESMPETGTGPVPASVEPAPVAVFTTGGTTRGLQVSCNPVDVKYPMPVSSEEATQEDFKLYRFGDNGKCLGLKEQNFQDGYLAVHDERVAEALRRHPSNRDNGGGAFEEVEQTTLRDIAALSAGEFAAIPEGGLGETDLALLSKLRQYAEAGALPPPGLKAAVAAIPEAVERFRVRGAKIPEEGQKVGVVQTRIMDLLELLDRFGIREPEAPDEGRGAA